MGWFEGLFEDMAEQMKTQFKEMGDYLFKIGGYAQPKDLEVIKKQAKYLESLPHNKSYYYNDFNVSQGYAELGRPKTEDYLGKSYAPDLPTVGDLTRYMKDKNVGDMFIPDDSIGDFGKYMTLGWVLLGALIIGRIINR